MNNTDRKRLERIYKCLAIPGCHCGASTQSMSVSGAVGYAVDVSHALPKARELLYIVGTGELWDGQFEELMCDLEAWHAKRVSQGWDK